MKVEIDTEEVKLSQAVQLLSNSVNDTLAFFDKLDYSNLTRTLTAFGQLRDQKDKLESLVKLISGLYESLDKEKLPDVLNSLKIERIAVNGKLFSVAERLNASIPENKREFGHRWLTDAGAPDLILPRVNSKSLGSFVKTYFQEHGKMPPEEAMTIHLQSYIQVRKA